MTRRRRILYVLFLTTLILVIALWLLLSSSWSLSLGLRFAAAALPGQLTVAEQQGSLLGPVRLRGIHYQDTGVSVSLEQANLDWRVLPLLYGKLEITQLRLDDVSVQLRDAATKSKPGGLRFFLPLTIAVHEGVINRLVLQTAKQGSPTRIDSIRFGGRAVGRTLRLARFDVTGYGATAQIAGELGLGQNLPLNLTLALAYHGAGGQSLKSQGSLHGDKQELTLRQDISGSVAATLEARATDVTGKLQWQGRLRLRQMDPHKLISTLPPMQVSGEIEAKGNTQHLSTRSTLGLESKSLGRAHMTLRAESDIALREFRFTADGDVNGVNLPPAKIALQGQGNRQRIAVDKLNLGILQGAVNGKARLVWQPQLALDADLRFQHLHTDEVFKNWPGDLSGRLLLTRKPGSSLLPIAFELREIKGKLRDHALQADLRGSWAQRQLVLDQLQATLGDASLQARGRLQKRWDLDFKFKSKQLEKLWPAVRGDVDLSGRLFGTAAAPRLKIQAQAAGLYFARTRAKSLTLDLDVGLARQAPAVLNLQVDNVRSRNGRWRSVSLRSSGSNAAQEINLQARNDKASVQLQLHGSFTPWRWRGDLDMLAIESSQYGLWQLQQPASIELAKNRYRLSKLCVAQSPAHLCAQLQWDSRIRQALVDAAELPLRLFNPWLPQYLQLGGVINAEGHMQATARGVLQAQLDVHSPDKSIRLDFPDVKDQLVLGASRFLLQLNQDGLQTQLDLPLTAGGGLYAKAALPHWSPQAGLNPAQALTANLSLDGIPADVVTRMIPDLARARGSLHGSLAVAGSLGQPQLRGTAQWRDGSIGVPVLGLNIHDIKAELKSARPNTLMFQLQARSGEGEIKLDGQTHLLPAQGWPTRIRLSSHNLEVSNISQAYIVVDSEAKLEMQGKVINIDGDVTIPQARLKPQTVPEGAISASPDIVVIRKRKTITQRQPWQVTTRLRVQLGDKVDFYGFGIRGKLRGNLLLTDAPGKLVMGQGEVNIADGIYRLRGRDLTIRRGRLIFSNTFIDDPALDVEAVRTIETVTAGVRLKGTLKQPQLTVFSEPSMPESEALAYLVLGHSLSQSTEAEGQSINKSASALGFVAGDYLEKGIGGQLGLDELRVDVNQTTQNTSLVVGKYLSPKLYLRYYSGIAQSSRLVQLQYQLSRRVQIQTESGYQGTQSVTGGDIFFTIEY